MPNAPWEIVPYRGEIEFKRVRMRNHDELNRILAHIRFGEYVVLLAPHHHEKTRLLKDLAEVLDQDPGYRPIYLNLWQARTDDEQAFFASVQRLIHQKLAGADVANIALNAAAHNARDLQNLLMQTLDVYPERIVLIVDHLHALPSDLVHSLLVALRAARMEAPPDRADRLVVVTTGGVLLANLSSGPTSPFNIAKAVLLNPWTTDQNRTLVAAIWQSFACDYSPAALKDAVAFARSDPYLLALLCFHSQELVTSYRQRRITTTTVGKAADRIIRDGAKCVPIGEAFQIIEEDPDTLLDALTILTQGRLPANEAHQPVYRLANRLLLSGAFVRNGDAYVVKNEIYRRCLHDYFTPGYVASVLRMNGKWSEAIDYLAQTAYDGFKVNEGERADVLEAVIQEIYAALTLDGAYQALAKGLRLLFDLHEFAVYKANVISHQLECVYDEHSPQRAIARIDLAAVDQVEVKAFLRGDYALRNEAAGYSQAATYRLISALVPERQPIGIITVAHYWQRTNQAGLPPGLSELRRFLRYAATAIDATMTRLAYQEIGRALLNADAVGDGLTQVLTLVANVIGSDLAAIYLIDDASSHLVCAARIGAAWAHAPSLANRVSLDSDDLVARALRPSAFWPTAHDRIRGHVNISIPLTAGGKNLGVLEVGFSKQSVDRTPSRQDYARIEAFAGQMAVAVHNVRLLQRADEALAERVRELEKLQDINRTLVSTLDFDAVLRRIIDHLDDLVPDSEVTIWLIDADTQRLTVAQSSITEQTYRNCVIEAGTAEALDFDARTKEQRLARHLQSNPALSALAEMFDLRQMLPIAIESHGRRVGVMTIYPRGDMTITSGQRKMLEAVADSASVAISNAAQYGQLRKVETKLRISTQEALYDVAHVLYHRLGNIVGPVPHHLKRLRGHLSADDLESLEALALIQQRVESLKDLLPAFKMIVNLEELALSPVNLNDVIWRAQRTANNVTTNHENPRFEYDPPFRPVWVTGSQLLHDALQSVLENAYEAMTDGGVLRIRLFVDIGGLAHLYISDTGSGIADATRDRIFELGFSTKRAKEGERGLGLFTCRSIMRKHGGSIELFDTGPDGTTFELILPTVDFAAPDVGLMEAEDNE